MIQLFAGFLSGRAWDDTTWFVVGFLTLMALLGSSFGAVGRSQVLLRLVSGMIVGVALSAFFLEVSVQGRGDGIGQGLLIIALVVCISFGVSLAVARFAWGNKKKSSR